METLDYYGLLDYRQVCVLVWLDQLVINVVPTVIMLCNTQPKSQWPTLESIWFAHKSASFLQICSACLQLASHVSSFWHQQLLGACFPSKWQKHGEHVVFWAFFVLLFMCLSGSPTLCSASHQPTQGDSPSCPTDFCRAVSSSQEKTLWLLPPLFWTVVLCPEVDF